MRPLRLAILGSTGSIGIQALDVAAAYPDRIEVVALAAYHSVDALLAQAERFGVRTLALADAGAAAEARSRGYDVMAGPDALVEIAGSDSADIVLNALVGSAGLRASAATLRSRARLALANKESLVAGGEVLAALGIDRIIPVDSEHSAIYQCLTGEDPARVARIWLTGSGGPFRGAAPGSLGDVTRAQALAHPRWTMGPKISIDSATLMNKGLEVIEAHWLFGVGYERIRVVVHPQSVVHSMVEFSDGSVKAHLGATDMRVPIQYALSYPDRWGPPVEPVDFTTLGALGFEPPDTAGFPCLALAYEAGTAGGTMPAVLNAANEVAVAAFLAGRARFDAIPAVVERVLHAHSPGRADTIEAVEAADSWARAQAEALLA